MLKLSMVRMVVQTHNPKIWEAQAGEFETSLNYIERPRFMSLKTMCGGIG